MADDLSPGPNRPLIAAALAAVGASLCCVAPLLLVALGVGGAWLGSLTALEPYRPIFIGGVLLFLGLAFRRLYLLPAACSPGEACALPRVRRNQRRVFWLASLLLLALLAFPYYASLLFG
ncbi:mercuric transporter MerT family protein [Thiohalobacter sp. IOR34]|uniref:mercuric transporter MerT family protein n=1 Tax=Thiohalobacter sp. IOR34 TaxID=3057176 RepID=UPI0025AFF5F1|nr:mercuric transporter MerT family protein [Thiohalobacter sp. IOR34]WJW76679.1 mercuric transporter MerT family protein [Thiohalobacter sp. IOR34]